jgi:hypothetical protein
MRSLSWLCPALWLCLLVASGAAAQTAPSTQSGQDQAAVARERFKRGEAAYQKGSYAVAIEEWQAAYGADPRPRIQYNLYQAHERLGQLQEAAAALQRYLSTADPDDPYYSDATARMAALQQRLQSTGIRLVGGVEGASINVSGHDWGRLPRPDRIPVQPGNHRIVVQLGGYKDFIANVFVPAAQVVDVSVQLERMENAGGSAPAAGEPVGGRASVTARTADLEAPSHATPFFIAAGVLGAGAIGSAVWMVNRMSELDGCDASDTFCAEEDAVRTQRTIAIVSTAVLGAGAIGALVYGLVLDGKAESSAAALCVPTGLGAQCRVKF